MARTVKVFEARESEDTPEPIPFVIRFTPLEGEPQDHEFSAHGKAPAGASLALSEALKYDNRGRSHVNTSGMIDYCSLVMLPGDWERFRLLLEDPTMMLDPDLFAEVFTWLIEQYGSANGSRPTRRSRRSSGSRPGDGRTELASVNEPEYEEANSSD